MIKNILTRMFSSEPSQTSELQPANSTNKSPQQSMGISSISDSFESTSLKCSGQFDYGVLPRTEDAMNSAKKQEELLKEKEKLREVQKQFEEMTQDNNDTDYFATVRNLFGDDKGTLIDYQSQTALNTYNEAEKSSQHISETVDETSDDIKKYFG